MEPARPLHLVVCLALVDLRPGVDPLTGDVDHDPRRFGTTAADRAALAWCLDTAPAVGARVTALTVGPVGADAVLRDALAAGVDRVVRVDVAPGVLDGPTGVETAARAAAIVLGGGPDGTDPADVVVCGEHGPDRASAAFAALVAHHLDAVQVTRCTELGLDGAILRARRRLDRGRREQVEADLPVVVSVEPGVAHPTRASLPGVLTSRRAPIEVVAVPVAPVPGVRVTGRGPWRARSRELPSPRGDVRERLLALTGALETREARQALTVTPDEAADAILSHLETWGHGGRGTPG